MKMVSLDVHAESSQIAALSETGENVLELNVATQAEELRDDTFSCHAESPPTNSLTFPFRQVG